MKQCPECSTEYADNISFCAKDGRSLLLVNEVPSRLCPHCANSIPVDSAECPYCKAEVEASSTTEWHIREELPLETTPPPRENTVRTEKTEKTEKTRMPKIVLMVGIVLCMLAAGMLGMAVLGTFEKGDGGRVLDEKIQELQAKDERLKALEAELTEVREETAVKIKAASESAKEAAENAKELAALRTQLKESQSELTVTKQRLNVLSRELERVSARQARAEPSSQPRPADRAPAPSSPARRPAMAGVYETVRATAVHEQPTTSSRIISRIGRGTRVNVVRSDGAWLRVVSKRGNPPGYILRDDTMFVAASN